MKNKKIILILFFGIVILGIIFVLLQYQRDIKTAKNRLASLESQVVETDCGTIEFIRVGKGYPIFVIHGALGGFDQGLSVAQPLINNGYQIIAISRFGYLGSPSPENATLDMQVDLYACLLDKLGIHQTAVLGVSAGATSAIRFAARYPEYVSTLILQVPAAPGEELAATPPQMAFTMMRSNFIYWGMVTYLKSAMEKMVGVPEGFILSQDTEKEVSSLLATTLPSAQRMDGFELDFKINLSAMKEEIVETNPYSVDKIKVPTLVIMALDDPLALPNNVRDLAKKIQNSKLFIVPNGGHPLLGHATEVCSEITAFLNSNLKGANTDQ
jgi:2-hydroxy-6-oxonona-2,4-dienedioate hydrolase